MIPKDFAVFIITHERADRQLTTSSLVKRGYSGEIYYIIDNEDSQRGLYEQKFGEENVFVIDKKESAKKFDTACNFGDYRATAYARNECWEIAKELGIRWFLMLDDDYTQFQYRIDSGMNYQDSNVGSIDEPIMAILDMFKKMPRVLSVAMAQGGDFIGGVNGGMAEVPVKRKLMNTFFCDVERPYQFLGASNEDVNLYVYRGWRGDVMFTVPFISIVQMAMQTQAGGMTGMYKQFGTYVKSFYSVLFNPSAVKLSVMQTGGEPRIHHKVNWNKAVPKILPETARNRATE